MNGVSPNKSLLHPFLHPADVFLHGWLANLTVLTYVPHSISIKCQPFYGYPHFIPMSHMGKLQLPKVRALVQGAASASRSPSQERAGIQVLGNLTLLTVSVPAQSFCLLIAQGVYFDISTLKFSWSSYELKWQTAKRKENSLKPVLDPARGREQVSGNQKPAGFSKCSSKGGGQWEPT